MFEEKMLLNKCLCGGFLYQHTDLEIANQYIYCPKCKEKHDKIKADMEERWRIEMRDKLIEIIENGEIKVLGQTIRGTSHYTEALADYLIANNVFVLPEQMKDSWGLALPFLMRLFATDEEQIEKVHREFERKEVKKILTDIRDYLVERAELIRERDMEFISQSAMLHLLAMEHQELTEYAKKLGVEL